MIRVVLADDHAVVRVGLRSLLELAGDIELVAEAETGEEAIARVLETAPDVLLLDMRLPRGDGLQVLDTLAQRGSSVATLVLTTFDDDGVALQAIERGARGYLLKDVTLERLVSAVRALARGETVLTPGLSEAARRGLGQRSPPVPADESAGESMTPRERVILRLLATGYSNREIAQALHLAEGTVKNHVSSILTKLGVRDRTRAVLRAAEWGYL